MSFAHAPFLGFAALLAIPIVIHLIRAHKFEPEHLGTLRFLQQALAETSARRRISNWLLLLLRLLGVALAVLLFARPFFGADSAKRETIILVDASGSMNARQGDARHFELALRRAGRIAMESAREPTRVWLCAETSTEIPVDRLQEAATSIIPAGRVDWASALRQVASAATPGGARRVYILTDRQRADLETANSAVPVLWSGATEASVESLAAGTWDAEVASLAWGDRSGNGADLVVHVVVHGTPTVAEFPVEVLMNGAGIARKTVPAVSGAVRIAVPVQPSSNGVAQVRLISGDPLLEDDSLWIPLMDSAPTPVRIVAAPAPVRFESEGYYIAKALAAIPTGSQSAAFAPVELSAAEMAAQAGDARGGIVLADCDVEEAGALARLVPSVKAGLGVIIFLGPRADAAVCAELTRCGLLPASPALRQSTETKTLAEWDDSDPAVARYALDRRELAALRWTPRHDLQPLVAAGGKPLMRFEDNSPAMVSWSCGKGRVLVATANPTRRDGDWVIQRIFAPWMRDCVSAIVLPALGESGWTVRDRRFTDTTGFGPVSGQSEILRFAEGEGAPDTASEEEFRAALQLPAKPSLSAAALLPPPPGTLRENEPWPWILTLLLGILGTELLVADWRRI
jgi:Aerotolerance regulator N-terminal